MELDEHDRVHIVFRLHDMFYTQGSFDGFLVPQYIASANGSQWGGGNPVALAVNNGDVEIVYYVYSAISDGTWSIRQVEYKNGAWIVPKIVVDGWNSVGGANIVTDSLEAGKVYFSGRKIFQSIDFRIYEAVRN